MNRFGILKGAEADTFRAIIESRRWHGRFIIAAKAAFTTQYFVSVSKNLLLHMV